MKKYSLKFHLVLFVVAFLFCGCESEDDTITVTMRDGHTITTNSSQRYYTDEDSFVHGVSFAFARSYDYSEIEEMEYQDDSEGKVTGYNQSFIGSWEIAKFGEWIRDYGLESGKAYYIATKVYVKYTSMPPIGLRIVPKYGGHYMGYCPDIEQRTFRVYNNPDQNVSMLITGVRYIGYDSERSSINCEVPSFTDNKKDILTWEFLVRDDGWD
jgi:hypothetical protein